MAARNEGHLDTLSPRALKMLTRKNTSNILPTEAEETNTDFSRLMEGNVPTCGGRGSFRGYDDLPEYGGAERYMDSDFSRASTMRCTGLDKLFR